MMKKRICTLFSCLLIFAVLAVGCTDKAPTTPDSASATDLQTPTKEDVLDLFFIASTLYTDIGKMDFLVDKDTSILRDDITYYKVIEEDFPDYASFKEHLLLYFTANLVNTELLRNTRFIEGEDGSLYASQGGSGTPFYAGFSLGEIVFEQEQILLPMTVYFTPDDSPYTEKRFSKTPENPENFRTEAYTLTLLPEDHTWKFDTFRVFY